MMAVAACAVALLTGGCSDRSETEIIWLCDKAAGQSLALFPDADSALVAGLGLVDEVPSSMSAFLVHKDGKWLLFDTGLGLPDGGIRRGLDSLGLSPADIDYLFITHFHGDHGLAGTLACGYRLSVYHAFSWRPYRRYAGCVRCAGLYRGPGLCFTGRV